MFGITIGSAFVAGILSFFTPCILPMVPFYLCYMGGISMAELRGDAGLAPGTACRLTLSSVFFAAGVTTIFVLLGMGATAIGSVFSTYLAQLKWVAAAILTLFGLHFLGVIRVPVLNREARVESAANPATVIGAYAMGLAFGFGWTPCVGPALAAILMVASGMSDVARGGLLLFVYGIGMTAPFVITAAFSGPFLRWMAPRRDKFAYVQKVMGGMLILFAILIVTNSVNLIANWMIKVFPAFTALG